MKSNDYSQRALVTTAAICGDITMQKISMPSLLQRMKAATSREEIDKLLKELSTYTRCSPVTAARIKNVAAKKIANQVN